MNAMKLVLVLCAFSLLAGPVFAEITEAKTRSHRRHISDRYHRHRYEERYQRVSPPAGDFQRYRQDRSGSEWNTSCLSLPYLLPQHACSTGGGDGL
jgi:hypothetical protein